METNRLIFVPSSLDDYGLTSVEFRVYGRVARRGEAIESVPNMARALGISERTIQRALRLLFLARLIQRQERVGETTLYRLLPQSSWAPANSLPELRKKITKKISKAGRGVTPEPEVSAQGVTPEQVVGVTPESDEGTPLKVLPEIDIRARVENVFTDYCETIKVVSRTPRRLSLIKNRLLEGRDESQLHSVWIGALRDPWPDRKLHNDITHLLETHERIERMIELSTIELPVRSGNGKQASQSRIGPRTKTIIEHDYSVFPE